MAYTGFLANDKSTFSTFLFYIYIYIIINAYRNLFYDTNYYTDFYLIL